MTKSDKNHWIIVLVYNSLLLISLMVFLREPNLRIGGRDCIGLILVVGPSIGTILLVGFFTLQMAGKRISLVCGLSSIAFLILVSLICWKVMIPIIEHV